MDAEIMYNIRAYNKNAEQLAVFEVLPGLSAWRGGVAGGTGNQLFISKELQNVYVRPVSTESLFISELKAINKKIK